jgi:hypothetical protein
MNELCSYIFEGFSLEDKGLVDLAYSSFEKAGIKAKVETGDCMSCIELNSYEMNRWIVGILLATDYGFCASHRICLTEDPFDLGCWIIKYKSNSDPISLFWEGYFNEQVLGESLFSSILQPDNIEPTHYKAIYLNDVDAIELLIKRYGGIQCGVAKLLKSYSK